MTIKTTGGTDDVLTLQGTVNNGPITGTCPSRAALPARATGAHETPHKTTPRPCDQRQWFFQWQWFLNLWNRVQPAALSAQHRTLPRYAFKCVVALSKASCAFSRLLPTFSN